MSHCFSDDPVTCAAMRLGITEQEVMDDDLECQNPDHDVAQLNSIEREDPYARLPYKCLQMASGA